MLERAGADVTPETRQEVEGRLLASGRTKAQAGRETETLARMWSILSRIAGADPNKALLERIKPGKEGQAGAGALHQPPIDADVDLDAPMRVVAINRKFAGRTAREISSQQATIIEKATGIHHNDESGLDFTVSNSNVRHAVNTAVRNKIDPQAALEIVAELPGLIKEARRAETHADQKNEPDLKRMFRYFAGAKIGDGLYTVMLTVKEKTGQPKADLSIFRVYDTNAIRKKSLTPIDSSPPEGDESYATSSSFETSLKQLLSGVKDSQGKIYFEQPAYHGGPHRFNKFSTEHIGAGEGLRGLGRIFRGGYS